MPSLTRFRERLAPSSGRWQAAAVLAPLLLLGALGLRGLQVSRQAALADARQQAERALDQAWPPILSNWQGLRQSQLIVAPKPYPATPAPAPANETQALYEHALSLTDPAQVDAELARPEFDGTDALAPSGVPLLPLVAWARLRLLEKLTFNKQILDDVTKGRAAALGSAAVRIAPSVLTPSLLAAGEALLRARGSVALESLAAWHRQWEREEEKRAVLRLRTDLVSAHGAGQLWVTDAAGRPWWIERGEAGEDLRMQSLAELTHRLQTLCPASGEPQATQRSAAELNDAQQGNAPHTTSAAPLPDYDAFTLRVEGMPAAAARGETLAHREAEGLAFSVVLANPERLYARQRQQVIWLTALLLCALLAALAGFRAMRRALAREQRLGQLKSDFVSSVSHELRAPVASMRLMAENLESGAVPTEERRGEYHRLIAEECRRLSALIDNVLDFARIEQDRKTYDFAETDVAALVRDALDFMRPRAVQRRQEIRAELAVIDPPPLCDGLAVRQALINLLDNAIKFSPEGTRIDVALRMGKPREWEIAVRDEGPGIAAAEHEVIFERFHRLGSELRRETQGAGIGLSIVRHIAQAHGGKVEVASEPGSGSTFTLVLPTGEKVQDSRSKAQRRFKDQGSKERIAGAPPFEP